MRWIVFGGDPLCNKEGVAGGKGSSLARLKKLGANVPAFFVISAEAYRAMGKGELTADFLGELREALQTIDASGGLAVRSSAIGEDAADSSFAGLYHTSLEVKGLDAVVEAVKTCWASYCTSYATGYREERDARRPDGAMAVVVQEMIAGEWSGVCFTANPVNLSLSQGLINGVPGLGEALVSGEVNPEEITLRAADGHVLMRKAGDRAPALPAEAISEVWRVSKSLANQLRFPQDVEWSWNGGKLFVLQSRPITTIADVFYSRFLEPWKGDPKADPDAPNRMWSRLMADETWVSPISPLFYDIHNLTAARVNYILLHDSRAQLPPDIFKYHRATAYADVNVIRRMYEYQPRMARIRGVVNFLPTDQQAAFQSSPWRWMGRLRRAWRYETQQRNVRSFFRNYSYVNNQWADYVAKTDRWFDTDLDTLSLEELKAHQAEVGREMAIVGPPCGVAVLSHASDLHLLLTGLLDKWCRHMGEDGESLYARVSSGLDCSETVRLGDALWGIAQKIKALGPNAVEIALSSNWQAFRERSAAILGGKEVAAEFKTFWRHHRHLGSTYKDLIWPRWGDDVNQCFDVVKTYLESAAERPGAVNERSAKSRRESQKQILAALNGPLAPFKRRILRWLFRYNELYMSVRDNHRYYVDRNWYEVRRIYRSYGARLVAAGVLQTKDDVFFLCTAEVEDGLNGTLDFAEVSRRIEVRRNNWQITLRQQAPKFLKGWEPYSAPDLQSANIDLTRLHGIAASPGRAIGTARVVYDVRELSAVKDGEILVTRQTDPSWTTVFGRIGGLVLETGGVLSHGTSLCREYGLPCVTAVEHATSKIPNGSTIEILGALGTVDILNSAQSVSK